MYTSLQQLHRRRCGCVHEESWWSCFPLSAFDHIVLVSSTSNVILSCALGVHARLWSSLDSTNKGPLLFHFSALTTFLRLSWGDGETWILCNLLVLVLNTLRESGSLVTCSFRLWVDMFLSRSFLNNQFPFWSLSNSTDNFQPLDFSELDLGQSSPTFYFMFQTMLRMIHKTSCRREQHDVIKKEGSWTWLPFFPIVANLEECL